LSACVVDTIEALVCVSEFRMHTGCVRVGACGQHHLCLPKSNMTAGTTHTQTHEHTHTHTHTHAHAHAHAHTHTHTHTHTHRSAHTGTVLLTVQNPYTHRNKDVYK